ncbi:MAG: hypothetical protein ACRDUY_14585 [Nitriliruptorales bacterium]
MPSEQEVPSGLDPDVRKREVIHEADTENLEKMLHRATVREFTFHSDEPPELGGEDNHPRPLHYLIAAVGF